MDTSKTILFIIFLNSIICSSSQAPASSCPTSFCNRTGPKIRFPFHLENIQDPTCGFNRTFNLFCNTSNETVINLPNSGNFTVESINYAAQNIWLNDPENCLPRRLLSLNLSNSPFKGYFFQDFMFFNCSSFDYTGYNLNPVGCLSGSNYSVFASSSDRTIEFLNSRCNFVATVPVPVQWASFEPVVSSDLSEDIRLTWGVPWCGQCESRGGRCGLREGSNGSSTEDVGCKDFAHRGLPNSSTIAVMVGAGIPAFLCLVAFLCFMCVLVRRCCRRHTHPVMESPLTFSPRLVSTVSGLDKVTIESYPKTILGESRRLPMPDHSICSICLSEYMPKETLRSIPECQHTFHVECIDEWLSQNSSCPVCRNSPIAGSPNQPS